MYCFYLTDSNTDENIEFVVQNGKNKKLIKKTKMIDNLANGVKWKEKVVCEIKILIQNWLFSLPFLRT